VVGEDSQFARRDGAGSELNREARGQSPMPLCTQLDSHSCAESFFDFISERIAPGSSLLSAHSRYRVPGWVCRVQPWSSKLIAMAQ
jgi:hypothetical protein